MINRRRVIKVGKKYIEFNDEEVKLLCCLRWGDYYIINTKDNEDNTVTITKTFVSKKNTTIRLQKTVSVEVKDNTNGEYIAGTTYEAVGMTQNQVKAVTAVRGGIQKIVNSKLIQLTTNFPKDIPVYGFKLISKEIRKADCSAFFKSETNNTFRVYFYHQQYGYINGSTSHIEEFICYMYGNKYGFFGEYPNNNIKYPMYFNNIGGYKPTQFSNIHCYIFVDPEYNENETVL